MTKVVLVTHWVGDGLTPQTGFRPQALLDFPFAGHADLTEQRGNIPPSPNLVVIAMEVDDATLAAIAKHPDYDGAILWSESNAKPIDIKPGGGVVKALGGALGDVAADVPTDAKKDESPPAAEFDKLITCLSVKGKTDLATARAAIGSAPNGKTRQQIAQMLIAWLRTLPKA